MTITQMLGQSGLLTLLGMCVVFGFIVILICCMKLLQLVVRAFKLDKKEADATANADTRAGSAPVVAAGQDLAVVAAIAAAIREKQ